MDHSWISLGIRCLTDSTGSILGGSKQKRALIDDTVDGSEIRLTTWDV